MATKQQCIRVISLCKILVMRLGGYYKNKHTNYLYFNFLKMMSVRA